MSGPRSPWWELDPESAAAQMARTAEELRDRDEARRVAVRVWDDLYEGRRLLAAGNATALDGIGRDGFDVLRLNFARRAVDHVHAKVTSETPTVRALGHGADSRTRVRARRLSKFIRGVHDELRFDVEMPRALLGCLRTGTGATVVSSRDGRIRIEQASAREVHVDPDDARHGDPRVLYRITQADRRGVALDHPDHADEALSAPASADPLVHTNPLWTLSDGRSDAIDLYEAWVLPRGGSPGRHVVAIASAGLVDEPWDCPRFPIALLFEREPSPGQGLLGLGLMSRLDGLQFEIDDIVAHIGQSIRHANLRVFVQGDSDVIMDHLTDPAVGTVVTYEGNTPPTFHVVDPVSQQEIAWLKLLVSWLYSMAGMDEGAVSSQIPAGITSGIGQRMYHDFQSQTYVDLTRRYGRHVVDVTQRVIDEAKRMSDRAERDGSPSWTVRYRAGSVVSELDWRDVDMDADSFLLELEEVSPVPDSPAGRVQQIEEDAAAGRIPPEYLTNLREDPDRWLADRLMGQADVDFVDDVVERLQDPDLPVPVVVDEMDLNLAASRLRTEVLHAIRSGDDPAVVERLRRYLSELSEAIDSRAREAQALAAQQAAPQGIGAGPAPGGPVPPGPPNPGPPQTNG